MMTKQRARAVCLLLLEGALIYLCGLAAIYLRFADATHEALTEGRGWLKLVLSVGIVQGAFYLFDLYDFSLIRQRAVLTVRIFQALGLAAIVLALIFYALPQMMLGRGVFLVNLLLTLTIMTCWRLFAMWLLGHPRLAERVLILGTGASAIELARELLTRRTEGYRIIGFVGDDPQLIGQSLINPSVIGVVSDLEEIARRYQADRIVVAFDDQRGRLPFDPLLKLKLRDDLPVSEAAAFTERLTGKINTARLRPSQLIFSDHSRWARIYRRGHRLADFTLALVGLVASAPLMLLAAIAIKLDSPGPVFYLQERVGWRDKVFKIIKFRSMRTDAEAGGPAWAGKKDPRATRVGRLIRKLRIDELPQFINVIRGEMNFIGPRPERPVFVEQLERRIPYYGQRHMVKPGLTGWAQVRYPYGASVEDAIQKLQYDLYYIKNQSPMLDLIILLETVRIVLFGRLSR